MRRSARPTGRSTCCATRAGTRSGCCARTARTRSTRPTRIRTTPRGALIATYHPCDGTPVAVRGHRRGDGGHPRRDQAAPRPVSPTSRSTRRPTGSAAPGARTRYPGLSCDVPSHLYSYSFALIARLEPPLLARPGDPGVLRTRRATSTASSSGSASATRSPAASSPTAAGSSTTAAGTSRRSRRGHRGHRRAAPPEVPRHRGPRLVRGRDVPQRALGPRRPARRRAGRHHRHRFDRGADRLGDRRPRRAPLAVPADGAVDHAAGEPGVHRRGAGRVPRATRAARGACTRTSRTCSTSSPTRSSTPNRPRSR